MITNIEMYLNNEWLSIEKSIESFLQYQNRADEAFAIGNFKAWLSINKNIPPYTPLLIKRDDGSIEYFMSKSKANRYLTKDDLWVHDITIIDPTSVLACFIVGSKNFGATGQYKNDSFKIVILKELMEYKYPIYLNFTNSYVLSMKQEFTYGPGTTLYDILVDIAKTYNRLPKVTSYSLDEFSGKWIYNIEFIDLSGGSEYVLDSENIMSISYDQDSETYCNRLEAEVANVIDRTDLMTVKGLTFRSNELMITEDNLKLVLPTRIEEIKALKADIDINLGIKIYIPFKYINMDWDSFEVYIGKTKTLSDWFGFLTIEGLNYLAIAINNFSENTGVDVMYTWKFSASGSVNVSVDLDMVDSLAINRDVEIDNFVLPIEQYNSLEPKEQVDHVYYESGNNIIEGFNQKYKDDIWNKWLGNSNAPTLYSIISKSANSIKDYVAESNGIQVQSKSNISRPLITADLINYQFTVDYIPMLDMFVESQKSIVPYNENVYKDYSRTYNLGSNFVDFDRLEASIQRSNDMLGSSELFIEYKTQEPPYPTQYIMYDDVKWYVASIVRSIQLSNEYCTINLVRDYNKVAEAIGVKTQYSSTKNPLSNIVDRYIFVKSKTAITLDPNKVYFEIQMKNIVYKKATLMHKDNVIYCVCEADDQYSFGSKVDKSSITDGVYKLTQIPYVDSYNEYINARISLVEIDKLTVNQSLELPIYTGERTTLISLGGVPIYKDARERLIFTFKLTNATLKID